MCSHGDKILSESIIDVYLVMSTQALLYVEARGNKFMPAARIGGGCGGSVSMLLCKSGSLCSCSRPANSKIVSRTFKQARARHMFVTSDFLEASASQMLYKIESGCTRICTATSHRVHAGALPSLTARGDEGLYEFSSVQ